MTDSINTPFNRDNLNPSEFTTACRLADQLFPEKKALNPWEMQAFWPYEKVSKSACVIGIISAVGSTLLVLLSSDLRGISRGSRLALQAVAIGSSMLGVSLAGYLQFDEMAKNRARQRETNKKIFESIVRQIEKHPQHSSAYFGSTLYPNLTQTRITRAGVENLEHCLIKCGWRRPQEAATMVWPFKDALSARGA